MFTIQMFTNLAIMPDAWDEKFIIDGLSRVLFVFTVNSKEPSSVLLNIVSR